MKVYWDHGLLDSRFNSHTIPIKTDILVIGAGITGLSASRELLRNGRQVVILEAGNIGHGASGKNAGFTTVGLSLGLSQALNELGFETTKELFEISRKSVELVEHIIQEDNINADFKKCGRIKLATKKSHLSKIEKEYELTKRIGLNTSILSCSQLSNHINCGHFHGGLYDSESACLNPRYYLNGLAKSVENYGGIICENHPVIRIHCNKDATYDVYYVDDSIQANQIIIATNGYTPNFIRNVRNKIINVGSYIVVTEPLTDQELNFFNNHRLFSTYNNLLNYFRLTPDNRLLFGGRNNLLPDQNICKSEMAIHRRLREIIPQLEHKTIQYSWGGRLAFTMSRLPYIGKVEENIFYSIGYCGHGVPTATWCGKAVANYLLSGSKPIFALLQHKSAVHPKLSKLFLQSLSLWYRMLDKLT